MGLRETSNLLEVTSFMWLEEVLRQLHDVRANQEGSMVLKWRNYVFKRQP
jgi:hypothetical protein